MKFPVKLLVIYSITESISQNLFIVCEETEEFLTDTNLDKDRIKISNRCGVSRFYEVTPRIIGGRNVHVGEYPWTVSLHKKGHFSCGGSIINEKTILTAAHCVDGVLSSDLIIRYNSLLPALIGFKRKVSRIIIYPNYNNQNVDNDIAILYLTKALHLNNINAGAVCLPDALNRDLTPNDVMTVIGWGVTDGVHKAKRLRAVDVPLVPLTTCRQQYTRLPVPFSVTSNMICAGTTNGGKDACSGDSGGPMVRYDSSNNRYILVGIVSKGYGCALPNVSGIYTKVANYVTWIQQNTKNS